MSTLKENFYNSQGLSMSIFTEAPKISQKKSEKSPIQSVIDEVVASEDWGAYDNMGFGGSFGGYAYDALQSIQTGSGVIGSLKDKILQIAQKSGDKPEEVVLYIAYRAWKNSKNI